jgi:hypothetical protein
MTYTSQTNVPGSIKIQGIPTGKLHSHLVSKMEKTNSEVLKAISQEPDGVRT